MPLRHVAKADGKQDGITAVTPTLARYNAPLAHPTTMSSDPYQPPRADPHSPPAAEAKVPALVIEHLRCTRPWVKFCSLSGYITSGFLVALTLLAIRAMLGRLPVYQIALLGGFSLVLALLFTIPSIYLSRYEKSITHLTVSHRVEDLEQALADQRSFWKQMAMMILILLVLYLITIAFSAILLLGARN